MSPTGKGPLRIAVEDFLDTFGFGKRIAAWIKNTIEGYEREAIDTYERIINDLGIASGIPPIYQPDNLRAKVSHQIELVAVLLPMLFSVGTQLGHMVFAPLLRPIGYLGNALFPNLHADVPTTLQMMQRRPDLEKEYTSNLVTAGYDKASMEGFRALVKQLLPANEYVVAYRRGLMSDNELSTNLMRLGMDEATIKILLEVTLIIPNVQDLIRMAVREAFSPQVIEQFRYGEAFPDSVLEFTRKQGLSDDWVKRYWYAHWELPSPNLGYEMLHRLRPGRSDLTFTDADLDLLLRTADYAPYFRDRMKAVSYSPVTRVDIRRMYRLGIYDAEEVKQRYMDIGYNEKDAQALSDFTVKYETGSGASSQDQLDNLSAGVAKAMYKKGIITKQEYSDRLELLKYPPDVVELIIKLADEEIRESLTPDYRKDFIGDMKNDVEKAYAARMIDEGTARTALGALGIKTTDVDYIIKKQDYLADLNDTNDHLKLIVDGYISGTITRDTFIAELGRMNISGGQQNKIINAVELQLTYRNRRLTESQYRAATLKGIITQDDYKVALKGLGVTDKDIDILVKLYFPTGA